MVLDESEMICEKARAAVRKPGEEEGDAAQPKFASFDDDVGEEVFDFGSDSDGL